MFLLPEKARTDLEFDRLLTTLAGACRTPMGAARARRLDVPAAHDETRKRLQRGREALDLEQRGEPLPIAHAEAISEEAVGRLSAHGVLSGAELLGFAGILSQARVLRRFLASRSERAAALSTFLSTDPQLDPLHDELRGAFDNDGLLADSASPKLAELRAEARTLRQRMQNRLNEFAQRYGAILQDDFVTEREGRMVMPVRADAHERFPGIVHATSASGQTLFVEPRALVPMGNRLKVLDGELAREEQLIFARLSGLLSEQLPSARHALEVVAEADVLRAMAELAAARRLRYPDVDDAPRVQLRAVRHPLLWLDGTEVVPSDLTLEAGHAVIVSGPNAGGKTVALKSLGLCAVMLRAGLPIPCGDGSRMGLFDAVLTDVGDDQSLQKNLSTFSAHVRNLVELLDRAEPRTLVLLDELAGGTDPREGEALAAGVLASLTARGATVMCTTHYEGLKALALGDPRFGNASVGFDRESLRPTFQLMFGVPGASSALMVARQYGMPSTVLERAEAFLTREDRTFEELVAKLHAERLGLEQARTDYEDKARLAAQARQAADDERSKLTAREIAATQKELREVRDAIRKAHEAVRDARATLRTGKGKSPDELRKAERELERASQQINQHETALAPPPATGAPLREGELKRGAKVYLPKLRKEVSVLELQGDSVQVQAGALKLTVRRHELSHVPNADAPHTSAKSPKRSAGTGTGAARAPEVALQTSGNTCDLRGLRVDEALGMTAAFLDRAFGGGERVVFLVHGHGTGALRDALRTELSAHPQVASFRAGGPGEGGDGATLVWFD